jgi:hypothetical protein
MTPLGQRLLRRAVPIGVVSALIGYGLAHFYLAAIRAYAEPQSLTGAGPSVQGPLVFGLVGFGMMAVLECVRKS